MQKNLDGFTPSEYLGRVLHVRAFLSFDGRLYICEETGWAAIFERVTLICVVLRGS
jgi:hypothetical protein